MLENLNLIQVTPSQLKKLLEEVIEAKLKDFTPVQIEDEEYLTRKEAAKFLKIGLTKLNKLRKEETIVPIKEGRSVFYLKSSLKEYRNSLMLNKGGQND